MNGWVQDVTIIIFYQYYVTRVSTIDMDIKKSSYVMS